MWKLLLRWKYKELDKRKRKVWHVAPLCLLWSMSKEHDERVFKNSNIKGWRRTSLIPIGVVPCFTVNGELHNVRPLRQSQLWLDMSLWRLFWINAFSMFSFTLINICFICPSKDFILVGIQNKKVVLNKKTWLYKAYTMFWPPLKERLETNFHPLESMMQRLS